MIALLKGIVIHRSDPYIIIDVHGVGYKVLAASSVLSQIKLQDVVSLSIYTHVREDTLELYGFKDFGDLQLFEQFLNVSGIGPKTAVGIFSVGTRGDIIKAILQGDAAFFTAVPRLGKKNAQKLIIELKGKLGTGEDLDINTMGTGVDEVSEALKGFGFTQQEAITAIRATQKDGATTSEKIRLALKYLGK